MALSFSSSSSDDDELQHVTAADSNIIASIIEDCTECHIADETSSVPLASSSVLQRSTYYIVKCINMDELRILRTSDASNNALPRLLSSETKYGHVNMYMAFTHGVRLCDTLHSPPGLLWPMGMDIVGGVIGALQYIHRHGCVHRNVRANTIEIACDGVHRVVLTGLSHVRPISTASGGEGDPKCATRLEQISVDIYDLGQTLEKSVSRGLRTTEGRTPMKQFVVNADDHPGAVGLANMMRRMQCDNAARRPTTGELMAMLDELPKQDTLALHLWAKAMSL